MNKHITPIYANPRKIQVLSTIMEGYQPLRKKIRQVNHTYSNRRGRGKGRGTMSSHSYKYHFMTKNFRESVKPKARFYSEDEYSNLNPSQKY